MPPGQVPTAEPQPPAPGTARSPSQTAMAAPEHSCPAANQKVALPGPRHRLRCGHESPDLANQGLQASTQVARVPHQASHSDCQQLPQQSQPRVPESPAAGGGGALACPEL